MSIYINDMFVWISVWKISNSVCMVSMMNVRSISVEDIIIYCCSVFSEDFVNSWIRFIIIFFKCSFCYMDIIFRYEV